MIFDDTKLFLRRSLSSLKQEREQRSRCTGWGDKEAAHEVCAGQENQIRVMMQQTQTREADSQPRPAVKLGIRMADAWRVDHHGQVPAGANSAAP
jgi:hypothetical protein